MAVLGRLRAYHTCIWLIMFCLAKKGFAPNGGLCAQRRSAVECSHQAAGTPEDAGYAKGLTIWEYIAIHLSASRREHW